MLLLKPGCEYCNVDLPADSTDAMTGSFECTFCKNCVENKLPGCCPNCGGTFAPRPPWPAGLLDQFPAVTERVYQPQNYGGGEPHE